MNHFSKQSQSDLFFLFSLDQKIFIFLDYQIIFTFLIPGTPNILVPGERLVFILFMQLLCNYTVYIYIYIYIKQTKVRKINVMRRGPGKFKAIFPLLNKRIRLQFLFDQYTFRIFYYAFIVANVFVMLVVIARKKN